VQVRRVEGHEAEVRGSAADDHLVAEPLRPVGQDLAESDCAGGIEGAFGGPEVPLRCWGGDHRAGRFHDDGAGHPRPTSVIAATMKLSPYTVQDYLKSIFDKVGVRSRRELAGVIFREHHAPLDLAR
jgi:hypothetical protein